MTRKHFVEMARILKNLKPVKNNRLTKKELKKEMEVWEFTCKKMAGFCAKYNHAFNWSTFLSACGINGDE